MPAKKKKVEARPDTGPIAGSQDPASPHLVEKEVTRRVRIKLNREDEQEALDEMLDTMRKRDEIEAAKAAAMGDFRKELKEVDAKIDEKRQLLEFGEWGDHICTQIMDTKKKTVRVILIATGDEIESRPMTEEERQGDLF